MGTGPGRSRTKRACLCGAAFGCLSLIFFAEPAAAQNLGDGLLNPKIGGFVSPQDLPGRKLSAAAIDYLRENDYTVVTWNAVPRDWLLPTDGWIARAKEMIAAQDWTVLVLHDAYCGVAHLPQFLDGLDDSEIEFADSFPPDVLPIRDGTPTPGLAAVYQM